MQSKNITTETVQQKHVPCLTDGAVEIQPDHRLYTVSLPPEGYVPALPEPDSCGSSEGACSDDDAEDLNLHDQPKKRIRKRKSKKKIKNPNDIIVEQTELEKQQSLLQEKSQLQDTDIPTMSRNKKRKLRKKQQLQRKKAAGLVSKASGLSFMYQPEGGSSGQDPQEHGSGTDTQEDTEFAKSRVDGILHFLKSTKEIYFYDGVSRDSDSAVRMETAVELLQSLETHGVPPSDVFILDHMKTLLLLQDTDRLKSFLEIFPEHCMMPPDYAGVITAFFNYWITHILPEKNSE